MTATFRHGTTNKQYQLVFIGNNIKTNEEVRIKFKRYNLQEIREIYKTTFGFVSKLLGGRYIHDEDTGNVYINIRLEALYEYREGHWMLLDSDVEDAILK